jgi:hypothetical protein
LARGIVQAIREVQPTLVLTQSPDSVAPGLAAAGAAQVDQPDCLPDRMIRSSPAQRSIAPFW